MIELLGVDMWVSSCCVDAFFITVPSISFHVDALISRCRGPHHLRLPTNVEAPIVLPGMRRRFRRPPHILRPVFGRIIDVVRGVAALAHSLGPAATHLAVQLPGAAALGRPGGAADVCFRRAVGADWRTGKGLGGDFALALGFADLCAVGAGIGRGVAVVCRRSSRRLWWRNGRVLALWAAVLGRHCFAQRGWASDVRRPPTARWHLVHRHRLGAR